MTGRPGLEIRAAGLADAVGLAELLAAFGPPPPRLLADRLEKLRRNPGCVLLALEWGPPSGVIVAHWVHGLMSDAPVACIRLLFVAPEARRRGIARLLLKAAAQAARVAGCDMLEVTGVGDRPDLSAFVLATGFAADGGTLRRSLRKVRRDGDPLPT